MIHPQRALHGLNSPEASKTTPAFYTESHASKNFNKLESDPSKGQLIILPDFFLELVLILVRFKLNNRHVVCFTIHVVSD